jgi:asparagine synthase (glutamine-hydrolysing)
MCGIFTYLGKEQTWENLKVDAHKIKYRGPENTHVSELGGKGIFVFHRLAIMGVSETGDQPMQHPRDSSLTLVCNGEIYNYKQLAKKYGFRLTSGSDCEIILFMYKKFGMEKTVKELDGVFMFVLHDETSNTFYAGRDPIGVRPGFIGKKDKDYYIASEAKPMVMLCDTIEPFPPGSWWSSKTPDSFQRYFHYNGDGIVAGSENEICEGIRDYLSKAVEKRMMAEREIGCLLSGGLDSSLITALVAQHSNGNTLKTFSIGISGSIDLEYAQRAAKHISSIHHQIEVSEKDFLDAIETVIYNIESYDTTTVRASVGNYLVSKFIRENSDCKVVFNGDGADEVCGGYVYLKNAPSSEALQAESEQLVKELYLFDVLRSDRSISSNGLEARTPFLDKAFVKYYLSIPSELKMFDGKKRLEKHLLRQAFDQTDLLPDDILWRRKCAFSDGVSNAKKSWHTIIQNFVDDIISHDEFERESAKISHCPPALKESYYYRKVYRQFFGKHDNLIPHFWMPKWTNVIDPSARELDGYKE